MSTRPETIKLSYLVDREWFEREVLAGRDPDRKHTLEIHLADLEDELAGRAAGVEDSIATDQAGRVEVHGTGINPRAVDPDAPEIPDSRDQMMDGSIVWKIGWLPELPEPSDDPATVIAAWETWLDAYRAASPDALKSWVERWHPGDDAGAGAGNETWWRMVLPYRVDDGEGDRNRSITFDGRHDLELFQRVRAAKSRLRHATRMTTLPDAVTADQALGSEIVNDGDTFLVGKKPADRDALVEDYEQFVSRWRKVALAARANRLRRKGAFDREMREWAAEHGSERLQLGLEDNFRMTAVYLEERLGDEFPGFYAWSEPFPNSNWRPRVGPTETALHGRRQVQEKLDETGSGLKAEIVWLVDPPRTCGNRGGAETSPRRRTCGRARRSSSRSGSTATPLSDPCRPTTPRSRTGTNGIRCSAPDHPQTPATSRAPGVVTLTSPSSRTSRRFSPSERAALFVAAGGGCSKCGRPLDASFHADHVHPWAAGGITDPINGQALCPVCNLRKGATH